MPCRCGALMACAFPCVQAGCCAGAEVVASGPDRAAGTLYRCVSPKNACIVDIYLLTRQAQNKIVCGFHFRFIVDLETSQRVILLQCNKDIWGATLSMLASRQASKTRISLIKQKYNEEQKTKAPCECSNPLFKTWRCYE